MAFSSAPPPVQLRERLARARRAGEPFDLAWRKALRVGKIDFPNASTNRRGPWLEVFEATRDEWRAAYEGEPTRVGAAAAALLLSEHKALDVDLPGRVAA